MGKAGTAAEYRALLKAKRDQLPTEFVTVPSGLVWEVRRPDMNAYLLTGRYPQSLVNEGLKALRDKGLSPTDPEAIKAVTDNLNSQELTDALIFMRELVREACINPKIVLGASKADEIDPTEIDIEDFNFIVNWCMNYEGVKNAAGIRKFRTGRTRRTSGRKSHGKKLRRQTVSVS